MGFPRWRVRKQSLLVGEMEWLVAEIFPRVMLKSVWSGVRLGFGSPFCLSLLIPLSL